ncbi:hypothetical protein EP331_09615 [bacterium]|nr:MAG: hypothetical protein EP331_09615 [bacterium]
MITEFKQRIHTLMTSPLFTQEADSFIPELRLSDTDQYELKRYHSSIQRNFIQLFESYLCSFEVQQDEELLTECTFHLKQQLAFLWIELQSEWIRFTHLANYNLSITSFDDKLIQAKSAVCSYFLEPIFSLIDADTVEQNLSQIRQLVNRTFLSNS